MIQLKEIFIDLKKIMRKNISYFIKKYAGEDGEATDRWLFNDLGMMRYADLVCPL